MSLAEATSRVGEPLTWGLPLPVGTEREVAATMAAPDGTPVDLDTAVLLRWPNGSPRWLLLEFALPPGAAAGDYTLCLASGAPSVQSRLATSENGRVRLRSGELSLEMAAGRQIEIFSGTTSVAVLTVTLQTVERTTQRFVPASIDLEWNGSQRATAVVRGAVSVADRTVAVELRVSTYASSSQIRCDLTVHNPSRAAHEGNFWELGDAGSVLFSGLALELQTSGASSSVALSEGPGHWRYAAPPLTVYQESSGGANWQSRVHRDRSGRVPMQRAGFILEEGADSREGSRIQPAAQLGGRERSWSTRLLRFWEEFPSTLQVNDNGRIVLEPFPLRFPGPFELQGGEKKTRTCVFAHGTELESRAIVDLASDPSSAIVSSTDLPDALPFLHARQDPRHDPLIASAIEGEQSFFAKRERVDEYGWRHFGDLFADHESAFLQPPDEHISHYNNQYDAVFGFGLQLLRSGDPRWWALMDPLARHVTDIDLYHTTEDKAAYNGGMFWHTLHYLDAGLSTHRSYPRVPGVGGGGPAAEQNYNAGLALHYLLTGWEPSRQAAIGLGRWVIDMDDGSRTPFRWLSRAETGLATASGSQIYHGPGRAGAHSIKALLVAYELTDDRRYLQKAEELIRRCVHPNDDIAALTLLDAERRWFYTVFLEVLGQYIWLKHARGERDAMYGYARRALLHFARWMREYEYPYLDKPEILEFKTETWSAQDIRKSDVLAWAALCERGAEREAFLAASKRFLDDVMTRLPSMPTHRYARPTVVMLARGYAYYWAVDHPDFLLAEAAGTADPARSTFVPQRVIAVQRAKALAAVSAVALLSALIVLLVFAGS